jgi:transposase
VIEHPSGAEMQWDWDELGVCPWDPTTNVSMLVGSLSHSSMSRAWLASSMDQPHLVEGTSTRSCAASVAPHECGGQIGWGR